MNFIIMNKCWFRRFIFFFRAAIFSNLCSLLILHPLSCFALVNRNINYFNFSRLRKINRAILVIISCNIFWLLTLKLLLSCQQRGLRWVRSFLCDLFWLSIHATADHLLFLFLKLTWSLLSILKSSSNKRCYFLLRFFTLCYKLLSSTELRLKRFKIKVSHY